MNWAKSLEGAAVAGVLSVLAGIGPFFLDGKISPSEWYMLVVLFGGSFFSYLKTHVPADLA